MSLSYYSQQGLRQGGRIDVILAAVVGLLLAAGIAFLLAASRSSEPVSATVLPEPIALPAFQLEDDAGQPFGRDWFIGRSSLLFFGFTHCPDVCPLTLQQLTTARRQLAADNPANTPDIVFISVDPERDAPEQMADYVTSFGEGVTGAVGELTELNKLTSALGIYHARTATEAGHEVEHSAAILYIDDEARFSAVFSAPHKAEDLIADWPALVGTL